MKKIIIAAVSKNRIIGSKGSIPWHSKEELQYFKSVTIGYPIIMGRKTFESLKKPLKERLNIVITRNSELKYDSDEVKFFNSLQAAIHFCESENNEKVFIIGGGEIYNKAIHIADELYISLMNFEIEGDTYFPEINPDIWKESSKEKHTDFEVIRYMKT